MSSAIGDARNVIISARDTYIYKLSQAESRAKVLVMTGEMTQSEIDTVFAAAWVKPGTAPVLTALVPNDVPSTSPPFLLRVIGTGLTPESVIVADGVDRPTTFVSIREVSGIATLPTDATKDKVDVQVRNVTAVSNVLKFTIAKVQPLPAISSHKETTP